METPPTENLEIRLNSAVSYRVENQKQISIHIAEISLYPLAEKIRLVREGLHMLSLAFDTDARLKQIETVTATSWIVTEHPKLLEGLGFTIDSECEEANSSIEKYKRSMSNITFTEETKKYLNAGYAYISKDEFKRRHM